MNQFTAEQIDYLTWLKNTNPVLYSVAVQPLLSQAGFGTIGALQLGDTGGLFSSILDSVTNAYQTYATTKSQADLIRAQTAQAARTTSAGSFASGTTLLLLGAAALVGVILLVKK